MVDFPVSNVGPLKESDRQGQAFVMASPPLALQKNIRKIPKGTEGMEIGKDRM